MKRIPYIHSGPGSEAKEKCCKEQTVSNNQSETIRKKPHFLPWKIHSLVPQFWITLLLRSTSVTQFLTVHCFCCWWCARTGHPKSRLDLSDINVWKHEKCKYWKSQFQGQSPKQLLFMSKINLLLSLPCQLTEKGLHMHLVIKVRHIWGGVKGLKLLLTLT
jgi:hypothetical protein